MSFSKKHLLPFLPFTNHLSHSPSPHPSLKCFLVASGIGLTNATRDTLFPQRVGVCFCQAPPPPPLPPLPPGEALAAGFFKDVGEVVDGLMSCTESLGFESSDERGIHERSTGDPGDREGESAFSRTKRRGETEKIKERKFPSPLTSLNDKGRLSYFLKPVRRDGRLEVNRVEDREARDTPSI